MEQIIKTVDYKLERFWNLLITALPMGTTFRVREFKNFFYFLHKHLVLETITIVFLQYDYLDP